MLNSFFFLSFCSSYLKLATEAAHVSGIHKRIANFSFQVLPPLYKAFLWALWQKDPSVPPAQVNVTTTSHYVCAQFGLGEAGVFFFLLFLPK